MGDRVPISTIPGLASAWVNEDVMVLPAASAPYTVVRTFLQRNGNGAGDTITAALRTATGGGGDAITTNFGDGESEITDTASQEVASGSALYLRITAADANSENIRGWVEIEGGVAVTTGLTTSARVKRYLGITASTWDTLLNELITSVSEEVQTRLGLRILVTASTGEKIDSVGNKTLPVAHYPIVSITSVSEDGTALIDGTDFESTEMEKKAGLLARLSAGKSVAWARGTRIVEATYTHGYSSVPDDIQQAATEMVAFDWFQSQPGGQRLGLGSKALDTGGTTSYRSREEMVRAIFRRLAAYRRP